eukprot:CAMPEP_0178445558 /NCGR_PEP_ID=MMETSP0689_2-20121128/40251_1 /TAXON_ID=160604 /ORGANISM="Amphidinium massartii, Strain CS-259" /LENGTH=220 /DNA_ID=CAMNT_0020070157 /DNA_START=324 /DNA_END=987 /DNA_ORIENTATION=-
MRPAFAVVAASHAAGTDIPLAFGCASAAMPQNALHNKVNGAPSSHTDWRLAGEPVRDVPANQSSADEYAKMYLIYQSVIWVVVMFAFSGALSAIVWLHRHGLLHDGPGPARAARPGLIEELETVEYSESLFDDMREGRNAGGEIEMTALGDSEAPECSICSEAFGPDVPIKRTPCGHLFHKECLGNWLGNYGRSCPLCRENLEELVDGRQEGASPAPPPY